MMASKQTEWILETIDHLRRRKARPDLERICHVVNKRYGLGAAETEAKIEKLVEAEIVIKVDYKGSTSYRNAAKWRKSMLSCTVLNSTNISVKILEAILDLSEEEILKTPPPTTDDVRYEESPENTLLIHKYATEVGVSLENISTWLQTHCEGFDSLRSPLTVVLKREIEARRLNRLLTCNYVITEEQIKEITATGIKPLKANKRTDNPTRQSSEAQHNSSASSKASSNDSSSFNSQLMSSPLGRQPEEDVEAAAPSTAHSAEGPGWTTAPPSRRGRPPKHRAPGPSHGPAGSSPATPRAVGSSNSAKVKRSQTADHQSPAASCPAHKQARRTDGRKRTLWQDPACDLCKLTASNNEKGVPEVLLWCKDCVAKAHPSCMSYSPLLASRAYRSPWQCMDCKTCCVCLDAGDPDLMLVCDGCDKGYHMTCHHPAVTKKPSGKWECSACRLENLSLQRSEFMSRQGSHHSIPRDSAPPTPAESPVPSHLLSGEVHLPTQPRYLGDGQYPDARGWSVSDVMDYFTSAGFKDEAQLFLEQEIDGVALLLLKRTDVLRGLNLKLGPALKLNRHVQGLQAAGQHENL